MSYQQKTCARCGTIVNSNQARCPVCGASPDVGALVVRRSYTPAVRWQRVAVPVAAGATVLAVGTGIRLIRQLLPGLLRLRTRPQPPAVVTEKRPSEGRIVAVKRRVWAVGDSSGARHWGAEETVWRAPGPEEG